MTVLQSEQHSQHLQRMEAQRRVEVQERRLTEVEQATVEPETAQCGRAEEEEDAAQTMAPTQVDNSQEVEQSVSDVSTEKLLSKEAFTSQDRRATYAFSICWVNRQLPPSLDGPHGLSGLL